MDKLKWYRNIACQAIHQLGYFFNEKGILKNITNIEEPFKFTTQSDYEKLSESILEYIQKDILETQLKIIRRNGITEKDYYYYTPTFTTNNNACLVMIQGSGPVRPGY